MVFRLFCFHFVKFKIPEILHQTIKKKIKVIFINKGLDCFNFFSLVEIDQKIIMEIKSLIFIESWPIFRIETDKFFFFHAHVQTDRKIMYLFLPNGSF